MKSVTSWGNVTKSVCKFCTAAAESVAKPRPFGEIPGPKGLPFIGTLHKYLPLIGEYDFRQMVETGRKKFEKFGPIIREEIVPGEPIVWVFRPEDISEIFKTERGKYPERRSHQALLKYRHDRSSVYRTGGLIPTNGVEWWKLRREFQKEISKPQSVQNFLKITDDANKEFLKICENKEFDDFLPMLSRLNLKLLLLITFDYNLDCFSDREMKPESRSSKLIDAAYTTNSLILKLDNGPRLWRYFDTPMYKKLCKSQNYMESVAMELVSQLKDRDEKHASLIEIYLQNSNLDFKDIMGIACDFLLAGIDTTTFSSSFMLYQIAKHPEVLEKLHDEAKRLIPTDNSTITPETLKDAVYTKAVLKETFRMHPIALGVGRIMLTDVILSGYLVPKGTNVVTLNQISCRLPEYFENPDAFIPERWLRNNRDSVGKTPINPYLALPFGHGPRACIARRLAEQNMQVLLLRICRDLKFAWKGGILNTKALLINYPDGPIKLKFDSR